MYRSYAWSNNSINYDDDIKNDIKSINDIDKNNNNNNNNKLD